MSTAELIDLSGPGHDFRQCRSVSNRGHPRRQRRSLAATDRPLLRPAARFRPGPDRQRLQQLARDLGVLDQVHFMGFQPDAKRMLPRYRAYVHSALIENFPFVLVEAAAYGLPVLAAPVGGVPEVFEDGEQGF